MPPRPGDESTAVIPPPVGGINLATSVDKLQPTEAVHLRGYEFDEYGVLGVPRAPLALGTIQTGALVLSAHIFQVAGGTTQLIVHLDDGSLRYSTDFLTATSSANWTTISTGLSTSSPFAFKTWLSKVWMTNGVNDFRSWDGSTETTYPTAPKGKDLDLWRDTLWMGGDPSNPDRIYQCAAGDPTTWPALQFVDIEKGAGGGITAISAVESSLVVFKLTTTHIIFDPVEYTNRVIDRGKGCLSQFSVVFHNGQMYFVSHRGVCRYLGDGPSQIVSDKIQPLFDDLYTYASSLSLQFQDTSREMYIWGYSFENFVGWFIPANSISQYIKYFPALPDTPWIFGTPTESPSGNRSCTVSVREAGKNEQLYRVGGDPAILVREYGGAESDSLPCEWATYWFDFDSPLNEKYLKMLQVLHRGEINVTVKKNFDFDESTLVATGLDHGEPELQESTVYTDEYARSFQLLITSSVGGEKKSIIGTGLAGVAYLSRFQSGVSMIYARAKVLSDMRR